MVGVVVVVVVLVLSVVVLTVVALIVGLVFKGVGPKPKQIRLQPCLWNSHDWP